MLILKFKNILFVNVELEKHVIIRNEIIVTNSKLLKLKIMLLGCGRLMVQLVDGMAWHGYSKLMMPQFTFFTVGVGMHTMATSQFLR